MIPRLKVVFARSYRTQLATLRRSMRRAAAAAIAPPAAVADGARVLTPVSSFQRRPTRSTPVRRV
ncbi:MAG: hypothetical protein Q8K55_14290, partial [Gemmatimonadaceae bacterium]|nr:hypothetical protein [Gemmatimonadaceae bacterium]